MKTRSEAELDEQIQELKTITRLQGESTAGGPPPTGLRGSRVQDFPFYHRDGPGQTERVVTRPSTPKLGAESKGPFTQGQE